MFRIRSEFWNWERVFRIGSEFLELGVRFKNSECVYKFGVSFGIRSALVGHRSRLATSMHFFGCSLIFKRHSV